MKKSQIITVEVTWDDGAEGVCENEENCCGVDNCSNRVHGCPADWMIVFTDDSESDVETTEVIEASGPVVTRRS